MTACRVRPIPPVDPLYAKVLRFIVGFNAKSDMGPFNQFWSNVTGFDKALFDRKYRETRNPDNRSSNRYWINHISGKVGKCVETNIYSSPSGGARALAREYRRTEAFEYLLGSIKPHAVFCYNAHTLRFFRKRVGKMIPLLSDGVQAERVSMLGHEFSIIGHNHGWLSTAAPHADRLIEILSHFGHR
jgi:hypothetical protein